MQTRHCSVGMVYAAVRGGASDWIDMERSTVAELSEIYISSRLRLRYSYLPAFERLGRELWAFSWRRGRPNRASSEITRGLRGSGRSEARYIKSPPDSPPEVLRRFCRGSCKGRKTPSLRTWLYNIIPIPIRSDCYITTRSRSWHMHCH